MQTTYRMSCRKNTIKNLDLLQKIKDLLFYHPYGLKHPCQKYQV